MHDQGEVEIGIVNIDWALPCTMREATIKKYANI